MVTDQDVEARWRKLDRECFYIRRADKALVCKHIRTLLEMEDAEPDPEWRREIARQGNPQIKDWAVKFVLSESKRRNPQHWHYAVIC